MLRRILARGTREALPIIHGTREATTPWLPDSPLDMTGRDIPAILASVEHLAAVGGSHRSLELVFTIREEEGLLGAKNLDVSLLDSSWGVVMDGSGPVGGIVVRAPSQTQFKFKVTGRAAHAGVEPEKGANAIGCAARAVSRLKLGRLDGQTTSNIGLVSGGEAVNIVPETAVVEGELRSHSEERLQEETRLVTRSFEEAAEQWGCELESDVRRCFHAFDLNPASKPVVYLAAALEECGFEPELTASGGGSDANVLNREGLPAAVMNIGLVNAHSKDEYVTKEELLAMTRVITRLSYLAGSEGQGEKR